MITIMSVLLWVAYFISLFFAVFWITILITQQEDYPKKNIKSWPLVSILIPAYNEQDCIEQTLERVIALEYPTKKLQIMVVNDGSTDNTAKIVRSFIKKHPKFNITLLNQKNKGKGAGLNNGLKNAKGEYFICLDADSFVSSDALKKMLPYFANDNVAAVLPTLKVYKPENLLQKLQWYEYLINMFYKELMSKLDCVHVTPGPFSIYSTKILRDVGGFDEDNITEDLEIAFRLQTHHYKIIQLLDTDVLTIAPANFKELYHQRNRWFKGATLNAFKYRKTLFNTDYGDFGIIQAPSVLISGFLIIFMLITLVYYTLKPYVGYVAKLIAVNFDIMTLLRNFSINIRYLDLNYINLFVGVIMLLFTLLVIKKSAISNREKMNQYGTFTIFIYLVVYFIILGFIWIGVMLDLILRRKQRW